VAKPYMVRVRGFEDLVNVAVATQALIVHRLNFHTKSVFYVPFPAYDSVAIYYCELEGTLRGKYFLYNRFTGEVQVSESYVNDSRFVVIPIVDVVEQELLPKEFVERYKKKPKKKKSKGGGTASGEAAQTG